MYMLYALYTRPVLCEGLRSTALGLYLYLLPGIYIVATKAKTPNTNSTMDGGTFILVAAPQ